MLPFHFSPQDYFVLTTLATMFLIGVFWLVYKLNEKKENSWWKVISEWFIQVGLLNMGINFTVVCALFFFGINVAVASAHCDNQPGMEKITACYDREIVTNGHLVRIELETIKKSDKLPDNVKQEVSTKHLTWQRDVFDKCGNDQSCKSEALWNHYLELSAIFDYHTKF